MREELAGLSWTQAELMAAAQNDRRKRRAQASRSAPKSAGKPP
jgi:hypothetical protein